MTTTVVTARPELAGTCFDELDDVSVDLLVAGSRQLEVAAGEPVFPLHDPSPRVAMILAGTARSFLTAANGRQLTLRYARRGALIGKRAQLIGAHAPLAVHAMTDCTILEFEWETFHELAASSLALARAINLELTTRLDDVYAAVGDSAFGSVRQRVIRHLLMLATAGGLEDETTVRITHQQLANAVGSSREVIARTLTPLRDEGLLRTSPGAIELLNVGRLVASLNTWRAESPY